MSDAEHCLHQPTSGRRNGSRVAASITGSTKSGALLTSVRGFGSIATCAVAQPCCYQRVIGTARSCVAVGVNPIAAHEETG